MTNDKRVWVRGKPVRGFFGGLAFGLGVALATHALKLAPFDDAMFTAAEPPPNPEPVPET